MGNISKIALKILPGLLFLWVASCNYLQTLQFEEEVEEPVDLADANNFPNDFVSIQGQQIRQWGLEAVSSSDFADPEWAASQAIGSPDTLRCGDYQTAWATAGSDAEAWLEIKYPIAVHVTAVNIIQSFNPNQVVKVELIGAFDRSLEIYNEFPFQVDQPCPYTLPIPIDKTDGRFDKVRITIDQSVLGLGWNQIDAVELVGEAN
jgi:hypothetical protein